METQHSNGRSYQENILQVAIQSHGPEWKKEKAYREQSKVEEHIHYLAEYLEKGALLLDGPLLNNEGSVSIFRLTSRDKAKEILDEDPMVNSGIIVPKIRTWLTPFSLEKKDPEYKLSRLQIMHLLFLSPGVAWKKDLTLEEQPGFNYHVQYYSVLFKNQKLLLGGPFISHPGAMVILLSQNYDEAKSIASNDPAVKNGLMEPNIFAYLAPLKWI